MPLPTTIWLPSVHVDSIDTGNARAGFPFEIRPNEGTDPMIGDTLDIDASSLRMNLRRPDRQELVSLPVLIISQSATVLKASYAFRTQDLAATRLARVGKYIGYLNGVTTDGKTFTTWRAVLPVEGAFAT